jgi:hypothetical protein
VEEAESVAVAADGGYIVAGITKTFGSGLRDIWLVKLDSTGNLEGCGSGVNAAPTSALVKTTTSASTDTTSSSANTNAKVKNSTAVVETPDIEISIQCASE